MTQLLIKLFIFAALLTVPRLIFPPFFKSEYEQRMDAFSQRPYSVVFVGTSRTKCAVIPAYFDQLMQDDGLLSYNFGIDVGLMPMTLDWTTKLIDKNPSLKHVIIEITGTYESVAIERQRPDRIEPGADKGSAILNLSSQIDNAALWVFKPHVPQQNIMFFDHNRPLDELGEPCDRGRNISDFEVQAAIWHSRSIEQEIRIDQTKPLPEEFKARITTFLEHAKSRDVSVHFFVPPFIRRLKEREIIQMIYSFLPPENKIAVNARGPIYSLENTADSGHLNQKGAFAFTKVLADEFSRAERR